MRSACRLDYLRELDNPPDEPFKATLHTYINRGYRRVFATEEDRAYDQLKKEIRHENAALLRKHIQQLNELDKRITKLEERKRVSEMEQTKATPSRLAALATSLQKK